MKKKNKISKYVFICALLMTGILSLAGCNIHMSAEERLGIGEKTGSEEESEVPQDEITELPVIQVAYEPYDLYRLAEWAYGMSGEEVDKNKSEYGSLYITPEDMDFPSGNTGIDVYTDKSGMVLRWEDGVANYSSVVSNAIKDIPEQERYYYNTDYGCEPSGIVQAFPASREKSDLLEDAAEAVSEQLRQIGLSPALWYGAVADHDFWDEYFDSNYRREGFEPEDDIIFLIFKQDFQGTLIEDIIGESKIYVVYSSERKSVLLVEAYSPVYGEIISEENKTLISRKDASLLGTDILQNQYGIQNPVLTDLQLVYVRNPFGGIDSEKQTVTLYPAWKVNFQVPVGDEIVDDYILLNAENGIQYTNRSQLY